MALLTSLYLCSRTVYAAVGTPTGSGARVVAAAQTELPEGCLINGVITNEADLTAALKEFFTANKLPMNRVALIAGGSQFMHRILTLPAMSEKKRMAVLSHELASGGAEVKAPLDDYMLLSRDAKTRVDTVLATRVEQRVIAGYDALAKAVGFKLYSIDLGLAAPIKAVRTIPDLQQKTFVLLQFDDDTISACLFVQGQYTYSTRSRLFNPRGSAESGTEIAQKLSGLIQFHTTSKSEHRIETVCFAGSTADDLAVCRPGCEALGLQVDRFPDSPTVKLPSGTALADVLYAADFYLQILAPGAYHYGYETEQLLSALAEGRRCGQVGVPQPGPADAGARPCCRGCLHAGLGCADAAHLDAEKPAGGHPELVQRQYRAIPRRNAGFRVCDAVPLADRLFRRDDRAAEQLPRRDQQSAAPGRGCRRVRHHDPVHRLQRIDGRAAL